MNPPIILEVHQFLQIDSKIFFPLPICLNLFLSHNNPCFQYNKAITNFLVSHMLEIGFHDVIDRTVRMFTS